MFYLSRCSNVTLQSICQASSGSPLLEAASCNNKAAWQCLLDDDPSLNLLSICALYMCLVDSQGYDCIVKNGNNSWSAIVYRLIVVTVRLSITKHHFVLNHLASTGQINSQDLKSNEFTFHRQSSISLMVSTPQICARYTRRLYRSCPWRTSNLTASSWTSRSYPGRGLTVRSHL